jgi:hypothetical protein
MTPIRERKTQKKKWKGSVDVKTRSERRKEEKKKRFVSVPSRQRTECKIKMKLP